MNFSVMVLFNSIDPIATGAFRVKYSLCLGFILIVLTRLLTVLVRGIMGFYCRRFNQCFIQTQLYLSLWCSRCSGSGFRPEIKSITFSFFCHPLINLNSSNMSYFLPSTHAAVLPLVNDSWGQCLCCACSLNSTERCTADLKSAKYDQCN